MNEIELRINFRSKKTICEQLSGALQQLIEQGDLRAGTQLPPVRELAEKLRVNFNTVARAYRQLDMLGIISTQQGRGTYIMEKESQVEPPAIFSEEEFLTNLDTFLLAEALRTGQTPISLREVMLKHQNLVYTAEEPVSKRRRIKEYRKPGWRSWITRFGSQRQVLHRQKGNRLRPKSRMKSAG